ncbi:F0F1 ATP synthase subunit A [Chengkuizengella axinellae]|uniref:ATP synthase subunit a n=1 Tax=Chengkuizengella axinellae TaxID=3064388 RepID=A0ABT9J5D0_9BACL|nr:F0F1 ATP synthase subunit A [Chengkuizengella sp. 2205SS18-9]MDP5276822.1 F0F1 ATP synthase subunit A [Chengkuizengella sp. 2205SS18-9]
MHDSPTIYVFGLSVDLSNVLMIVVASVIVFVLAVIGTRKLSVENPGKLQNFMEWIVEFVSNLIASTMDMKKGKAFIMLGITLIMYIFVANMLGLPFAITTIHEEPFELFGTEIISQEYLNELEAKKGYAEAHILWWKSPTASLGPTMALALLVITLSHYLGITRNTKHYFKHYFQPSPLFFPIHVIEQASKLLTIGMRLFGNIFAGEMLIAVILMASYWGIVPLMAWQGFSVFIGAIQAFVFTILTMVYIGQSITHEENHG